MTQILVTIENVSMAAKMMSAIEKMKGVVKTSLYQADTPAVQEKKKYSPRIMRMRGIAKGVQHDAENDERLSYLLNK